MRPVSLSVKNSSQHHGTAIVWYSTAVVAVVHGNAYVIIIYLRQGSWQHVLPLGSISDIQGQMLRGCTGV